MACQYAGAGCTFRGPNKKVREHQADCQLKKEGESPLDLVFPLTQVSGEGRVTYIHIGKSLDSSEFFKGYKVQPSIAW